MSTLTKVFIVLLTISSIFLCGIVVTYVANADNYRDNYNSIRSERDSLKESVTSLTEQLNAKIAEKDAMEDTKNEEITSRKLEVEDLKVQLKDLQRDNDTLLQRVDSLSSAAENYSKTNSETNKMWKDSQAALTEAQAELTTLTTRFEETSDTLLQKMAIIQTLETEKKRILEEKSELQTRLDKLLLPTGKLPAPVVVVTPEKDIARPAPVIEKPITDKPVVTKKIGLKGLVAAVDVKNKMAVISVGIADGVKEGMKFHVTRGDKFICDILVIDTDAEESVGALELIEEQPKAGDTVSTNL